MNKKYIVELTDDERSTLKAVVKKLKGSSQKVKRANILLKADALGPGWTDVKIAEALDCRTKTVENVRQRFVELGFEIALHGKQRGSPPTDKLLDGEQEAKIIATRLGQPPQGYGKWPRCLRGVTRIVKKVIVVCDNLNTHTPGAFYETFEPERARSLASRIEFHYTPKHGSWLNIAENELSSMTRQCVSGRRIGSSEELKRETTA